MKLNWYSYLFYKIDIIVFATNLLLIHFSSFVVMLLIKQVVKRLGSSLLEPRHYMTIDVQGHLNAGMPQTLLHCLAAYPVLGPRLWKRLQEKWHATWQVLGRSYQDIPKP